MAMSVNPKSLMMLAAVLFSLGLVLFPLDAFADSFSYSLAVVVITLVGWSSGWMPPFMTALIFFALATIFDLLDPNLLFSGFGFNGRVADYLRLYYWRCNFQLRSW